jgi:hypothetical protein
MPELPLADRHDVVLPPAPIEALEQLAAASIDDIDEVAAVVGAHPTFLEGWAMLGSLARRPIERYAFSRVGYHRGLDALRAAGWGGTGFVRWEHASNRGFLRCLAGLRDAAAEIGETPEVERIDEFLRDLDPDWDDANLVG